MKTKTTKKTAAPKTSKKTVAAKTDRQGDAAVAMNARVERALDSIFGKEWEALTDADRLVVIVDATDVEDLRKYAKNIGAGNLQSYAKTLRTPAKVAAAKKVEATPKAAKKSAAPKAEKPKPTVKVLRKVDPERAKLIAKIVKLRTEDKMSFRGIEAKMAKELGLDPSRAFGGFVAFRLFNAAAKAAATK